MVLFVEGFFVVFYYGRRKIRVRRIIRKDFVFNNIEGKDRYLRLFSDFYFVFIIKLFFSNLLVYYFINLLIDRFI